VPTLRNVALRQACFHSGRFKTLKDALTFYVRRDTAPEKFYPVDGAGVVAKFDDLPPAYRVNVNTTEAPCNRRPWRGARAERRRDRRRHRVPEDAERRLHDLSAASPRSEQQPGSPA
jgi:hypothetical protein